MRTERKLLTGALLALCGALLAFCIVLAAGWSKAAKTDAALPEVRNNGTAIQWKYSDETDWRDLVALTELRGAAGENGKDGANGENGSDGKNGINGTNGKDGINGIDGKDGADGKNGKDGIDGADGKDGIDGKRIEVQRGETHIQWRYEGGEWQNLVAIADITGPAGQNGKDGANGKTPEFRMNESTLQWRYVDDEIWLNLYDLSVLKGLDGRDGADGKDGINGIDGSDGKDGADGADGNTPFIGENGNWWIGETDTGVKAAGTDGVDGTDGEKGDKGDPGEKGDKGDKGDAGQNGGSSGYFYGTGYVPSTHLSDGAVPLYYREMHNRGGLVSYNGTTIKLKKGHTYNVCVSGMVNAMTNDNSGKHSVRMTDGYDDDYCRYITLIEQSSRGSNSLCFNRIYDLTGAKNDVELKFSLEQGDYKTYLLSFSGSVTITALD